MRTLSGFAAILLSTCVSAAAQETASTAPPAASQGDEISQLRQELENLKQRLDNGGVATPRLGVPAGAQPASDPGFTAGYALVYARPHMKESFRSTTLNPVTGEMTLHPFDFDYDPSSRVWLQWQNASGVGVRARYWHFDHDGDPYSETATATSIPGASTVTVMFPANIAGIVPGDVLTVTNTLRVQTVDLEGTRNLKFGQTEVLGSAGLQYVQIEQEYGAELISAAIPRALHSSRTFHGLGPSLGASARHPLGIAGLSAVAQFHAALLIGEKTQQRGVVNDVSGVPGPPFVALRDSTEVTGAFETGIGLEWAAYSGDAGTLSIRAMYEGQLWTDAGAPTLTYLGFDAFSGGIVWNW